MQGAINFHSETHLNIVLMSYEIVVLFIIAIHLIAGEGVSSSAMLSHASPLESCSYIINFIAQICVLDTLR